MEQDPETRLPRSAPDPDNRRRLRDEAQRRLDEEERLSPIVIYGGPPLNPDEPLLDFREPAPVYGGPTMGGGGGGGRHTRRGVLWGILIAASAALGGIGAWLFKKHHVSPGVLPFGPQAAVYGGPPPPQPVSQTPQAPVYGGPPINPQSQLNILRGAIETRNGHFLSAVGGGGLGESASAPHGVALTTGATTVGPFETFTLIWVDEDRRIFALKTHDGHYVTAVHGGGVGGPDSAQSPIHTDSTQFGPLETFTVALQPDKNHATILTADGTHFLTAVKGGGVGGSNPIPIRTDGKEMTADTVFVLKAYSPTTRESAPVYGGPPPRRPE